MKSFMSVLCMASAALAAVPATLIEWQGCPDCTKYGDGLVSEGLDKKLGPLMNLTVLYIDGHHPGVKADPKFSPFAACAQHVLKTDVNYTWYSVLACANPGKTIEECESSTGFEPSRSDLVSKCIANSSLSDGLVSAMHKKASSMANDYPWAIVAGKTMPEPDTHRDDIKPFIAAVCEDAPKSVSAATPACQ
eukprot:TRINITY_DN4947_c5_g1_i1.p1 TRINITY_DN4947_c5_g1~~TRINITY_DN4947_c5_g1_i1.p1  ORF type:complete len:192 (+),score=44.03 TRINITY_DN4947_c5_g1_i1:50-625(+)